MVKIQDVQLAKRYAIRTFPALMYFRNGNPLLFDGDLRNEGMISLLAINYNFIILNFRSVKKFRI